MTSIDQTIRRRAAAAVRLGRDLAEGLAAEFARLDIPTAPATRRRLADGDPFGGEDQVVLDALLEQIEAIAVRETQGRRTELVALPPLEDGERGLAFTEVPDLSPLGEAMSRRAQDLRWFLQLRRGVVDQIAADAALHRLARS